MKKRTLWIIIGLVLLVSMFTYFKIQRNRAKALAQTQTNFYKVQKMDLREKIDATGSVSAASKMDIAAAYEGTVKRIVVKAGDRVDKGDILMSLSSSTVKTMWADAVAALRQAETDLDAAQKDLQRQEGLLPIQGASAEQVEIARNKVAVCQEKLSAARAKESDIKAKDNSLFLEADHETLTVRAPFSAVVAWINVREGDKTTATSILVTLMNGTNLEVTANIDENDINLIEKGQRVIITGNDRQQSSNFGTVAEVGLVGVDTSGIVSFPIRVKVAGHYKGLKPGMNVDLSIVIGERKNVLAIPAASIINREGRNMVMVMKNGKPAFIPVELGLKQGRFWEVTKGLREGDRLSTQGSFSGDGSPNGSSNGGRNGNRNFRGGMMMRR